MVIFNSYVKLPEGNGGFKIMGFFMIFMLDPVVGPSLLNKATMTGGCDIPDMFWYTVYPNFTKHKPKHWGWFVALAPWLYHITGFIGIYKNTIGPDSLWRLGVVIVPII